MGDFIWPKARLKQEADTELELSRRVAIRNAGGRRHKLSRWKNPVSICRIQSQEVRAVEQIECFRPEFET